MDRYKICYNVIQDFYFIKYRWFLFFWLAYKSDLFIYNDDPIVKYKLFESAEIQIRTGCIFKTMRNLRQ